MPLLPTQEHKVNSAFRFANKQSDSLKMKQSLDQLLGSHSKKNTEDCDSTPQSTSTLIRCVTGPQNISQDKNPGHTLGLSNSSTSCPNSSASSNPFFGHQLEFLANFTKTIDEIVLPKTSQSSPQLEKNFDFMATIFSALNKQPVKCNFPFSREALHDGTSNKQQQIFCSKLEQLRNLEERIAMAQISENRFGSKKALSQQNVTQGTVLKTECTRIEIPKRGYFQEISSLNSLDEEIDLSTKTESSRPNNLSLSPTRQLDSIPSPIDREVNLPMNFQKGGKMCYFSQSQSDFSDLSLQQRLESHHNKNLRSISDSNEDMEGQCSSKAIPGTYPLDERINKILRYKKKIIKWRLAHPPNRNFSGRSAVAGSKPRIKGKFVKKEEYQKYIEIQKKNEMN